MKMPNPLLRYTLLSVISIGMLMASCSDNRGGKDLHTSAPPIKHHKKVVEKHSDIHASSGKKALFN